MKLTYVYYCKRNVLALRLYTMGYHMTYDSHLGDIDFNSMSEVLAKILCELYRVKYRLT